MLYRKAVRKFQYSAYPRDIFTRIMSFDNVEYICGTCHLKAKKRQIPCQAVRNKLDIDEMPSELEALHEEARISSCCTKTNFSKDCCDA